jgi:hypothetical protein
VGSNQHYVWELCRFSKSLLDPRHATFLHWTNSLSPLVWNSTVLHVPHTHKLELQYHQVLWGAYTCLMLQMGRNQSLPSLQQAVNSINISVCPTQQHTHHARHNPHRHQSLQRHAAASGSNATRPRVSPLGRCRQQKLALGPGCCSTGATGHAQKGPEYTPSPAKQRGWEGVGGLSGSVGWA